MKLKGVKLHRSIKSVAEGNHGTSAANIIFLYDSAFKDEKLLFKVLIHELAHQYFQRLSPFDITTAGVALGWVSDQKHWKRTSKAVQLQSDSDLSLDEAYANAIELYFTDSTRLKTKSSAVYDWISDEYKDKIE